MKKTLIALMALAGVASAAEYTPLSDQEGWISGHHNYSDPYFLNEAKYNLPAGSLYGSGWSRTYSNYRFDSAITLAEGETLEWSASFLSNDVDSVVYLTLETNTTNIVIGTTDYESLTLGVGTTTTDTDKGYAGVANFGTQVTLKSLNATYEVGKSFDLGGAVSKVNDKYVMSIKVNGVEYDTVDLGESFSLSGVVFARDGANNIDAGSGLSALTIKTIPEPTTATLSLLALAGLAARRRRR